MTKSIQTRKCNNNVLIISFKLTFKVSYITSADYSLICMYIIYLKLFFVISNGNATNIDDVTSRDLLTPFNSA